MPDPRSVRRHAGWALLFAGTLVFPLALSQPREVNVGVQVLLFATLGTAWNLLGGYAGQFSFGHALFFGAGAYTSTLLVRADLSPWLGMLAGAAVAALCAVVIGLPTFRLAGHYFAIATIVLAEVAQTVVRDIDALGAARGLSLPILPSALVNYEFHESRVPYYYVILALYALSLVATWAVERHRLGYYLRAIREDETAAKSVGVSVLGYKLAAAAISAALTALAGSFYAQYVLFIDPDSVFPLSLSILIALVPIAGGIGRSYGPLLGALVLFPLSEATRIQFGGTGRGIDLVLYGALIVLISVAEPGGIAALGDRLRLRLGARARGAPA